MKSHLEEHHILPLRRVLLVGQKPVRSSPMRSLHAELTRLKIATEFSERALSTSARKWLKLVWRNDALVFVQYRHGEHLFFQRKLHLAQLAGCVVVRWWVGTDVLNCLRSEEMAEKARILDNAVELNIAVAPHLVEELESIGIRAHYVPSFCDLSPLKEEELPRLPMGVLAYLPSERKKFYGEEVLIAAIEANPDLKFIIVSDDTHSLRHYPNVRSTGWVEDMDSIWSQVGILLRVTEHDGLPRMVLEGLARGRYVIYSWPFEGCWYGKSTEQVLECLETFKSLGKPNAEGPEIAHSVTRNAGLQYVQAIAAQRTSAFSMSRFAAGISAVRCKKTPAIY